jgi:hypothetical protein
LQLSSACCFRVLGRAWALCWCHTDRCPAGWSCESNTLLCPAGAGTLPSLKSRTFTWMPLESHKTAPGGAALMGSKQAMCCLGQAAAAAAAYRMKMRWLTRPCWCCWMRGIIGRPCPAAPGGQCECSGPSCSRPS